MASSDSTEKIIESSLVDGEDTILSPHTSTTADCEFEDLPTHNFPSADFSPDDTTDSNLVEATSITQYSERIIHYRHIYDTIASKQQHSRVFIPQKPINVRILSYERSTSNLINTNPNLYTIEIQHGSYRWTIHRRYKHFQHLNQQLQLLRASLNIPFPTKQHREQRASFKTIRNKEKESNEASIPRFPLRPEALIPIEQMETRMLQLESYLKAIVQHETFAKHNETLHFLEISRISFIDQIGEKRKEGLIKKRAGDTSISRFNTCIEDSFTCCCCCCLPLFQSFTRTAGTWNKRWMFIKDSFVGYLRLDTGEIGFVMLMDQGFKIITGIAQTGLKTGLIITNLSRQMLIKAWTKRKAQEWVASIESAMETNTAKDFIHPNRFGSFAPLRSESKCTWFVDGCNFMSAVADAIEAASEEIMIADWWLSPEIYMKRPVFTGNKWRLDTLLQRKAEEGVRIFVLLYKEVELALGINSFYSKKILCSKHPNIKVLRHPDHVKGTGTLFWAHHEKLVIIDQSLAFVGGIDLCYGRWDDEQHRLTDLGSASANRPTGALLKIKSSHTMGQQLPGTILLLAKAANQVTLGTVTNSATTSPTDSAELSANQDVVEKKSNEDVIDAGGAKENFRKIGRRVAAASRMKSLTTRGREWADELKDKSKHLTEDGKVWVGKHFSRNSSGSEIDPNELPNIEETNLDEAEEIAVSKTIDMESASKENRTKEALLGYQGSTKLWIGKDYTNFIVKDFVQLDQPLQDFVDRTSVPRMPWHDIACAVDGKAARDVARHFIQRWNACKVEKMKINESYPFIVPKSYDEFSPKYRVEDNSNTVADCQVLRSVSTWSLGTKTTEDSIQAAYVAAIQNAKHYIYIENQFFITLAGGSDEVTNRIGRTLFERILRAHENGERLRIYVVMPLLPGFEGQIGTGTGIAMQAILHWNYASICRGPNSLLGKLRDANIDALSYLSFYGLRTHSQLNEQLVTELVYVHSKLMIVDDNLVICGSANINDRSLTGKRDSEVALVIQDVDFEASVMDGKPYQAGRFAFSLRKRLFREHLGLLTDQSTSETIDITDPVTDHFYKGTWIRIASLNTKIYEQVFRCIPCDDVTSFAQLREFQSQLPMAFTEPAVAQQKLKQIQGNLVLLPLYFLSQENLTPAAGTAESLMPTSLWT